jgi:prophage regulatory protein
MIERAKPRADLRVVRMRELSKMLSASEWTIRRWIHEGQFPAPIAIGPRNRGWLLSDVETWLRSRPEGRTNG